MIPCVCASDPTNAVIHRWRAAYQLLEDVPEHQYHVLRQPYKNVMLRMAGELDLPGPGYVPRAQLRHHLRLLHRLVPGYLTGPTSRFP